MPRNLFNYLLNLIVLIGLLSSCSFRDFFKKEEPVDETMYGKLEAETQNRWDALIRSNEHRMALTDKALEVAQQTSLGDIQQQTRKLTPTHESLKTNKETYQAFDSLQTIMLNQLLQNTDNIDTAVVHQIRAADDSVLTYRLLYDQAADQYNTYLDQHKKGLARKTGKTYEELRKPIFRLVE